jgi:hypothetical protein
LRWKFFRNVPIKSFYLEMRVAAYADTQSAIVYDIDVKNVLFFLWIDQLADFSDPRFPNDNMMISACTSASSRTDAISKLSNAAAWSNQAVTDNFSNRPGAAISRWNLALQLPFCFEVRTLSDRLVSSAPE